MNNNNTLIERIFSLSAGRACRQAGRRGIQKKVTDSQTGGDFNALALQVFNYQYKHVPIYRQFCDAIGRTQPNHYMEIPFLPISFFKTHDVFNAAAISDESILFKSSGTTLNLRSQHHVAEPSIYERSFYQTFTRFIASPKEAIVFALLPNYMEQGNSSLIYMVDSFINKSAHPLSGFYLYEADKLLESIQKARKENRQIILFGVSYALLDLAEEEIDLSDVIIIETGGMKGRRKEMIRAELHERLCEGLHVSKVYSEYGMSELLSQAYTDGTDLFEAPAWMKVLIRDVNDPFELLLAGKTGGVNVIDLANIYSCSFIATDDLGNKRKNKFKIVGRFDQSDIRGCNLLVN